MGNSGFRHENNVPGPWFTTNYADQNGEGCIACTECYSGAPDFFAPDPAGHAFVKRQPVTSEEIALCERQREICPVASIDHDP